MESLTGGTNSISSDDLLHLGLAYARCGGDIWQRLLAIGSGYLGRAAAETVKIGLGPKNPDQILHTLSLGLRNYCAEMAAVFPAALDGLSRDLDQHPAAAPLHFLGSIDRTISRPKTYVVRDVPVMMPVRIADASQGWALYFVSAARAQTYLANQGQPFTVVEVSGGRTPLAILGIDYRGTDLGAYQEIGVALFVRPKDDRREMPGMLFLSLTVSDEFNVERATVLWGYHKTLAKDFGSSRHGAAARFAVDRNDPTALSAEFPRFGGGRSTGMSCYTYGTIRDAAGREVPHKTLISRNANGEGMQIGGSVELRLGDGTQARCVCRLGPGAAQACVCLILRDLGLPKRPVANGWAEHMDALVSASIASIREAHGHHERMSDGDPIERVAGGVVTESMIVAAAKAGKRLVLAKGVVLTPLAEDKAGELHLDIERESP
jgi:Acetoacetate decarboxylase (ADC)